MKSFPTQLNWASFAFDILQWVSAPIPQRLTSLRENFIYKLSPAGTAECSPGPQSWEGLEKHESVPQGRLKIARDAVLGTVTHSTKSKTPRTIVLGNFQPSLRDFSTCAAQTQDYRPGLHSAVPAGLGLRFSVLTRTLRPVTLSRSDGGAEAPPLQKPLPRNVSSPNSNGR